MLKMLEVLDLDEDQEIDLLVHFKAQRTRMRALRDTLTSVVTELADGLRAEELSSDEIYRFGEELGRLELAFMASRQQFRNGVRDLLTPEQYGRLLVFEERFDLELIESIRSFRDRRAPDDRGRQEYDDNE